LDNFLCWDHKRFSRAIGNVQIWHELNAKLLKITRVIIYALNMQVPENFSSHVRVANVSPSQISLRQPVAPNSPRDHIFRAFHVALNVIGVRKLSEFMPNDPL
jgi:hypothetical protein